MLIVSKITDLKVKSSWKYENIDEEFPEEVPTFEELFKDSLSAFIGSQKTLGGHKKTTEKVTLRFTKNVKFSIEQLIDILDPEIKELDGGKKFEASFSIADPEYLCKNLLMYGDKVEIIGNDTVRNIMVSMLEESLSVYK